MSSDTALGRIAQLNSLFAGPTVPAPATAAAATTTTTTATPASDDFAQMLRTASMSGPSATTTPTASPAPAP
jgi:hypothetical protein